MSGSVAFQVWQGVAREVDSTVRSTCNANARHGVVDTVTRLQLSNNEVQHALTALISQMPSPKVCSGHILQAAASRELDCATQS